MYEESIIKHFCWSNMYKDMQDWVSSCKLCMETTQDIHQIFINPVEIHSAPFETIHAYLLMFHTPSRGCNSFL